MDYILAVTSLSLSLYVFLFLLLSLFPASLALTPFKSVTHIIRPATLSPARCAVKMPFTSYPHEYVLSPWVPTPHSLLG